MATNKRDIGEIDESLLLSSIKEKEPQKAERVKPVKEEIQVQEAEAEPVLEKPKETAKRKRNNAVDYTSTFLQKNEIKTRQCAVLYSDRHRIDRGAYFRDCVFAARQCRYQHRAYQHRFCRHHRHR